MRNLCFYTTLLLFVMPYCVTGKPAMQQNLPIQSSSSLAFIANNGQVKDQFNNNRTDIHFKVKTPGPDIFIGNGAIHYQWTKKNNSSEQTEVYRLDVELLNANTGCQVITSDEQPYYETYYIPSHPGGIVSNSFKKITYQNIYPQIDWVIYSKDNQLEYDFVLHEGANPGHIRIAYKGADSIRLHNGMLTAYTPFGQVSEQPPYSYEAATGKEVASAFALQNDVLSFNIAAKEKEIVIDPAIKWGSYFGGSGNEMATDIKTDALGNIYVSGGTGSTTNIATIGAHKTVLVDLRDGFLFKLNPNGTLAWATYFGGDDKDEFLGSALDASGNVYLCGITKSTYGVAHPSNVDQPVFGGGNWDGMVVKFNSSGTRIWGRYYGGSNYDSCISIAVENSAGVVYIGGRTASNNNIATLGDPLSDNEDAFVAKLNAADGSRIFGFYHLAFDIGGIACDANNFYITGVVYSSVGIATSGAHQTSIGGFGLTDGYINKYNSNGIKIWGTYYGGEGNDAANAIVLDGAGNIYIAGSAFSTMGISTSAAYQKTPKGTEDAFIAKFTNAGNREWGTYYGGQFQDGAYGMTLDGSGNVYITGETFSTSNISTTVSHQHTFGGGANDAFIAQFNNDGTDLKWGTYYGGKSDDDGRAITYSTVTKAAYICGLTKSDTSISTPTGYQPIYGQGGDAYVAAFTADSPYVFINQPFNDTIFCALDSVYVPYTAVEMQPGNSIRIELSDANGNFTAPDVIGNLTSIISGVVKGRIPNIAAGTGYRIRAVSTNPVRTSPDNGINIRIDRFPAPPEATNNGPVCEGKMMQLDVNNYTTGMSVYWTGPGNISNSLRNPALIESKLTDSGDYIAQFTFGACEATDTTHVSIFPNPPQLPVGSNSPICEQQPLKLFITDSSSTLPLAYKWTGPENYVDTNKNATIALAELSQAGEYILETKLGVCTTKSSTTVAINETPEIPVITSNSPIITGQELRLNATTGTAGVTYTWSGPDTFSSNLPNPVISPAPLSAMGTYKVTVSLDICSSSAITNVFIKDEGRLTIYPNPNTGTFTISGSVNTDLPIPFRVVDGVGHVMYEDKITSVKKLVNTKIILPGSLPSGNYTIHLRTGKDDKAYPLIIKK